MRHGHSQAPHACTHSPGLPSLYFRPWYFRYLGALCTSEVKTAG